MARPPDPRQGVPLLTSQQAAAALGIKVQTLYAYASRGLVKGRPGPGGRGRRYRPEDLEPLRARAAGAAAQALRFGEPVLDTRITRMTPGGPEYRGHAATALAERGVAFETVAELLWCGALPAQAPRWRAGDAAAAADHAAAAAASRPLAQWLPRGASPLAALSLALPLLATADPMRFDTEPASVVARARRLIPQLAASYALVLEPRRFAAASAAGEPVRTLALAIGAPTSPKALDLLRRALILCADHELNASTFAARVAASTGADLYACLSAAVGTFSGPLHGGASEQVQWLLREAASPDAVAAAVADRMRRGERLPGFGHPLYPAGDPRVPPLLVPALAHRPRAPRVRAIVALIDAMARANRPPPNVDVALAALCAALELPLGSGAAIFAIGRCAGWVAHVLEQQQTRGVLRPRARYVGGDVSRA
ncbi:MAG: helix-turn-helix domain-containing protein [Ideonella sp.]|nr:helix-turn-helix domain-containing protein [Ideonella sp.]